MADLNAGNFILDDEVYFGEYDARVARSQLLQALIMGLSGYKEITLRPTANAQRRAFQQGLELNTLRSAQGVASALISEAHALLVGAHMAVTDHTRAAPMSQHDADARTLESYQFAHDSVAKLSASFAPDVLERIGEPAPKTDN